MKDAVGAVNATRFVLSSDNFSSFFMTSDVLGDTIIDNLVLFFSTLTTYGSYEVRMRIR